MKKLFPAFILVFSLLTSQGQTYFAFPDSNCVWSVEKEKHLMKGDSLFNSILYKKYYVTKDTSLTNDSLKFVGLVRQDKLNKKIYGIAKTYTTEALMYDFNLSVNDTTRITPIIDFFSNPPRRLKVSYKDSILVNGQYRKRFFMVSNVPLGPSMPETWIEGIGSSFGPLSPGLSDPPIICPCFPTLLCEKVGTVTVYVNPVQNSCYKAVCTGVGSNELTKNNSWKIYPNPTSDILYFDTKENVQNITLYNSNSQPVENITINKTERTVDLSKLPKGIYFIRISTSSQTIDKKVIVTRN